MPISLVGLSKLHSLMLASLSSLPSTLKGNIIGAYALPYRPFELRSRVSKLFDTSRDKTLRNKKEENKYGIY